MWGRCMIVSTRGTARQSACHPFHRSVRPVSFFRPSPSLSFSSRSSHFPSCLRPHLIKLGIPSTFVRSCSTEIRAMAAKDREVLPDAVKPVHYDVSLFDLQFGGPWTYKGILKIDLKITRSTKEIVLNSKEIEVHQAEIFGKDGSKLALASEITYDKMSERVTFKLPQEIAPSNVLLSLDFTGVMNNAMAGFYRSKYNPVAEPSPDTPREGDFHYMLSTQFESCDARRAFPCFDEPNLKATFNFEIEVPKGQTALSNMSVKSEREGSNPDLKVVSFETTPVMSTYLLAWAVGDFEYVEAMTQRKYNGKSIPVRVYTTRGLREQARFALECAHRTIDYFSEVFEIEYPLPKADLLAVHEFAMGAMENWGLVTYRTTAVLFDEGKSDTRYKNRIAYVVAHELAHQWFGNLVTMDWWNELWLNEGFATWVGWLAVDHFYPEWNIWSQFAAEGVQQAFQLDSLRASHPIEVPVKDALEVDQIFDHISYLKGSSVIRMLSDHLGRDTFLRGVANYLKSHAYGNATTNDLWSALSKASSQDVNSFMDPWIRKIGFPVITVTEEPSQISIRQSRFLSTGDAKPEEDETTWWIPLGIKSGSKMENVNSRALIAKTDTVQGVSKDSFYKINKELSGFYRTNYPADRLAKLGKSLDLLSTEDKIGLIGDAAALAMSGEGSTAALLALLEGFKEEQSYLVWSQISSSLANLRSVFSQNESVAAGLKEFTLKLASSATYRIGWEFKPDEEYLTVQLRKLLIGMVGFAGDEKVVAEAKRRFELWTTGQDKSAVHTNLRSVIFGINVSEGGSAEFHSVKEEYLKSDSVDGKEICLAALGRTKDAGLVKDYLDFVFSDKVAIQDVHNGAVSLAANSKVRHLLWDYIKNNWNTVEVRLSANNVVFERFVRMGLSKFADQSIGEDIASFFQNKETSAYDRALVIVSDSIRTNVRYKERDEKLVLDWLQAHGYA
ncbi:peptidase family M1-domain-containing protein [Aspergillus alliaceus]|uniref:Aminopeptidase n=1 Tax=Petromyces alliaceus TaxID=209559 RepID=A0A5N7CF04_PETAA|nr:peptidase family M1-domain-containing protein [Aspergillus alliaceus]KAB8234627.1 peptidase family M1-domain-containing protein [Aspergillus alliaceus]KAE8392731.1 peptidase family M1-domain-containing protein [Aspergillus alliaceus]